MRENILLLFRPNIVAPSKEIHGSFCFDCTLGILALPAVGVRSAATQLQPNHTALEKTI